MNKFFDALQTKDELTENAMPTHSTSGSYLVDLFFKMGGTRNVSPDNLIPWLIRSLNEDTLLTMKAIFYNRNIRGGQGERRSFRIFWRYICQNYPEYARSNIENVPHYGRWDDLLAGLQTPAEKYILEFILFSLKNGDKLCAKWMPRESTPTSKKKYGEIAKYLMKNWGLTPKQYRKLLSGHTEVVENLMCENEWGKIDYNKVPSIAIFKYRKAFGKHDNERYLEWIESLKKKDSTAKVHADAIFPHTIFQPILRAVTGWQRKRIDKSELDFLQAQWDSLPNYIPDGESFIPVCDVSGSMNGLPMEVCVSLGVYLSERNKSIFKDGFITFSNRPQLQILNGSNLYEKAIELVQAKWDMNTNLERVFNLILNKAVQAGLSQKDMPRNILILSDMQFDRCVQGGNQTAMEMIRNKYKEANYEVPNVVFWNLRTSIGVPVKFNEAGTALVSGFSPSLMKNLLNGELNPLKIVMRTLNDKIYDRVKI